MMGILLLASGLGVSPKQAHGRDARATDVAWVSRPSRAQAGHSRIDDGGKALCRR